MASSVDASDGLKLPEDVGEVLVSDAELASEFVLSPCSGSERDEDAFAQRAHMSWGVVEEQFQPHGSVFGDESESER